MKVPSPGPAAPQRTAADAVRSTRCTLCRARPGNPCTPKGDHLNRWLAAYGKRRITRDELREVIVRLVVVSKWCVVTLDGCQRCGMPAPEGNDLCGRCEEAEGATALAVLRELAAERES